MILDEVFDRFAADSSVFDLRAMLANVFAEDRLNAIFDENAQWQRQSKLIFSNFTDNMGAMVYMIRPSVNAAYKAKMDDMSVTVKAVYDKLRRTQPAVVRDLVTDTTNHIGRIVKQIKATVPPLLPGYFVKIANGHHLRRTDRYIGSCEK